MLTINEILQNQKVVVFSYAEDTITITYKPYAITDAKLRRFSRFSNVIGKLTHAGKLKRKIWHFLGFRPVILYRSFLQAVISDWDITDNGKPVSIRRGLHRLPVSFVARLYVQMGQELAEVKRQTMTEEIKKKSSDG